MLKANYKHFKQHQSGQLLIELILAMGLLIFFLPAVLTVFVTSTQGRAQKIQRLKAANYMQQAQEALRVVRQRSWDQVAVPGVYHTELQSNLWELVSGETEQDGFTRRIEISNVFRDNSFTIVDSSHPEAQLDPSTKRASITVSWETPLTSSIDSTVYLTRYLDNVSFIDTTQADFDAGEFTNTTSKSDIDGEVVLASGGKGDWCKPNDHIVEELDLQQQSYARVVAAIEGRAFSGTNLSDGKFTEISITQDDPPQAALVDTIDGYETNDIFLDENYAYVATNDDSRDVVIIDLNTNQEVGYFVDDYRWGNAGSIYVKDDVGYVTVGPKLNTFDLSSKSGLRPKLDSDWLSDDEFSPGTGHGLQVVGDYAYAALDYSDGELTVFDVSDPTNISRVAYTDVNGKTGVGLFVNQSGTRAYLGTEKSPSRDEVFVINIENKSGALPLISSYDAGGMDPRDLVMVSENKLIVAGLHGQEYQVIDVADEANPTQCGGIELDNGIYGLAGVLESDGDAYSYVVTGDNQKEFKVIEGGSGGRFTSEGSFTSEIFDAQYPVTFNYILPDFLEPSQTTMTYQVAVAEAVSGSCTGADYQFVGPDGTSSTFFQGEGPIALDDDGAGYENPAQCFRYRVYFETLEQTNSPVLEQVTVNYSP